MLIVFEGIDGAGKGAQIDMLLTYFRQNRIKFKLKKYPTSWAKQAREHVDGKLKLGEEELADLFAQDIMREQKEIAKDSEKGIVIVCDRYLHSTLAYQAVGIGYEKMSNKIMEMGPIAAEVVILLDIDARKSAQRKERQKKLDRFEKDVEFLSKVRNNYLKEADELFLAHKFAVIDSTRSKEEVFSEVIMNIEPLIVKKIE